MPNVNTEPAPRKKYFRCKACNKYSRFIDENDIEVSTKDISFFYSNDKDVWTALSDKFTIKQALRGIAEQGMPRETIRLKCLHCKADALEGFFDASVPQPLLIEAVVTYAHCKKCKHDTRWPADKSANFWKHVKSLYTTTCSNCGAKTSWRIRKKRIFRNNIG